MTENKVRNVVPCADCGCGAVPCPGIAQADSMPVRNALPQDRLGEGACIIKKGKLYE